ncbi:MAG: HpcH/HpaI aldolase family protein [Armatimonadota bacterium]
MTNHANKISFGSWINIGHPAVAELMASAGFDWLAVDLEHGAVDISQCLGMIQAIKGQGVIPMARLPYNEKIWIRRALDAGFMGLIVPLVNSKEEAEFAVKIAKYPPQGERGIGYAAANMYGTRLNEYISSANREIAIIPQIETASGVENIEEILSVEGVDGIFMGPYDLSGSYGILGEFDHPTMTSAYEKVLTACMRKNKLAGIHVVQPSLEEVERRIAQGFNLIALSLDITLIACGSKTLLDGSRKISAELGGMRS